MSNLIKHYKRKPNVVEAIYLDPITTDPHDEVSPNAYAIAAASGWMHGSGFHDFRVSRDRAPFGIIIKTPEGEMEASPGDFIIKGMQGEFYPHKGDWFADSYEEVRDE